MNTRWMKQDGWTVLDVRRAVKPSNHMSYTCPFILKDCIDSKVDHPEDRLCAADEWREILLSWIEDCTFDDIDRFHRLHTILARCIHA